MTSSDRFYPCETEGFPPVKVYDYETNVPARGINNRDFRFEEVAVKSIFLMQEATSSGSFENNSYSYTEGVEFITEGQAEDATSFGGWTVSGGATVYIPESGVTITSQNLVGVTGDFYAFPIDEEAAIGLYNTGDTTYPSYPSVRSENLAIDYSSSDGPIIDGGTHQLYFTYKLNYGHTGQLSVVLKTNGTDAWYDTGSSSWSSSPVTGYVDITGSNIEVHKYQFVMDGVEGTPPTSLYVEVGNQASGSFITVDDVHIDALLRQNAFLDYIVPTGYMLQITPDVGFHDILSMFDGTSEFPNPHLKTLGPFVIDLGNLTDNLDNTLTATLDESDFRDSIFGNFKKYLWRALPITPNGQLGEGGLPARFEYVGDIIDTLFSITEVQEQDESTEKVIVGTKSPEMIVIVDGKTDFPGLTYPSPTSWRLVINLNVSSRTLEIKAVDSSGTSTSIRKVKLTNKTFNVYSRAIWNKFDEFGLVSDLERLPGESNNDYSKRLKRSYSETLGPSFQGVVNSATNELGLDKVSDAVKIEVNKNATNNRIVTDYRYQVTSHSLNLFSSAFNIEERLAVDPIHNTIDLTYTIINSPLSIKTDNGADVDLNKIEVISSENSTTLVNRVKLNKDNVEYVTITYNYTVQLLFKTYTSLESLISAINGLVDYSGNKIFTASVSSLLSGGESTLGLYLAQDDISQSVVANVEWSPVYLKRINEVGYKDLVKGNAPTLKQSPFYTFVEELKDNINIFWGSAELDRTRWDSSSNTSLGLDSIPTLFDPPVTKIIESISGQDINIEPIEAWGKAYIGSSNQGLTNYGLVSNLFNAGVGFKEDLVPDLFITNSRSQLSSYLEENISPVQNNNNIVLFSGQV